MYDIPLTLQWRHIGSMPSQIIGTRRFVQQPVQAKTKQTIKLRLTAFYKGKWWSVTLTKGQWYKTRFHLMRPSPKSALNRKTRYCVAHIKLMLHRIFFILQPPAITSKQWHSIVTEIDILWIGNIFIWDVCICYIVYTSQYSFLLHCVVQSKSPPRQSLFCWHRRQSMCYFDFCETWFGNKIVQAYNLTCCNQCKYGYFQRLVHVLWQITQIFVFLDI